MLRVMSANPTCSSLSFPIASYRIASLATSPWISSILCSSVFNQFNPTYRASYRECVTSARHRSFCSIARAFAARVSHRIASYRHHDTFSFHLFASVSSPLSLSRPPRTVSTRRTPRASLWYPPLLFFSECTSLFSSAPRRAAPSHRGSIRLTLQSPYTCAGSLQATQERVSQTRIQRVERFTRLAASVSQSECSTSSPSLLTSLDSDALESSPTLFFSLLCSAYYISNLFIELHNTARQSLLLIFSRVLPLLPYELSTLSSIRDMLWLVATLLNRSAQSTFSTFNYLLFLKTLKSTKKEKKQQKTYKNLKTQKLNKNFKI